MVEVCLQQGWAFPRETVAKIAEAFAIVTAASSFFHGSQTQLGGDMDRKSNDLFVFIVYQAGVSSNIPYKYRASQKTLPEAQRTQDL